MLSNPKQGQIVRLHYAEKKRAIAPYHGMAGFVVAPGRGKPRNHGVMIDGEIIYVPAGNLVKEEGA